MGSVGGLAGDCSEDHDDGVGESDDDGYFDGKFDHAGNESDGYKDGKDDQDGHDDRVVDQLGQVHQQHGGLPFGGDSLVLTYDYHDSVPYRPWRVLPGGFTSPGCWVGVDQLCGKGHSRRRCWLPGVEADGAKWSAQPAST